jgi:hypothetical protein
VLNNISAVIIEFMSVMIKHAEKEAKVKQREYTVFLRQVISRWKDPEQKLKNSNST